MVLFLLASTLVLGPVVAAARGDEPELVTVEFLVTVSEGTPAGEAVYLAGNAGALGGWSPRGVALARLDDGRHQARVRLPRGTRVEYKVTRGSWRTVEKGKDGKEIPNRLLAVEKAVRIEVRVEAWSAGTPPARRSTLTGSIRKHERFPSKLLGNERALTVYLPPGYETDSEGRYPVFYLQDGQNLFDEATAAFGVEWQVDETAERLIGEGKLRPILVVGIDNTPARIDEYTPWPGGERKLGGKGDAYARFVVEEVKPFSTGPTGPGRGASTPPWAARPWEA